MPAFQPGHKKVGGRQKGTLNKVSSTTVLAAVKAEGYDPIIEILSLLAEITPREQLQAWLKLLPFCFPQLKAIEISLDPDTALSATPENVTALYAAATAAARKELPARDARPAKSS